MLFVLHEKNIPCSLYEVDVINGEQCSNKFMQMNPKMDIPVLQNETLVVPSSNQIISYLEANYNDGEYQWNILNSIFDEMIDFIFSCVNLFSNLMIRKSYHIVAFERSGIVEQNFSFPT